MRESRKYQPLTPEERRRTRRFSINLPVKCRRIEPSPLSAQSLQPVAGRSLNISSKGLLFSTDASLRAGQLVEVAIDWPMYLDRHIPLALVVEGEVVRKVASQVAIRIDKYQFKTRRPSARSEVWEPISASLAG
jgi:hypothetical protein